MNDWLAWPSLLIYMSGVEQNPVAADEEKMEHVRSIFQPNFAGGSATGKSPENVSRQSSSTSTASSFNGKLKNQLLELWP